MRKFKLGNSLWEYTPKTNEFNSVDEAWNVLSNAFARSRTQDPSSRSIFMSTKPINMVSWSGHCVKKDLLNTFKIRSETRQRIVCPIR
jgi:hypothetical protein